MHYDLDPLLYTRNIILERYYLIGMGLKTLNFLGWVLEVRLGELGFRVGSTKLTFLGQLNKALRWEGLVFRMRSNKLHLWIR